MSDSDNLDICLVFAFLFLQTVACVICLFFCFRFVSLFLFSRGSLYREISTLSTHELQLFFLFDFLYATFAWRRFWFFLNVAEFTSLFLCGF